MFFKKFNLELTCEQGLTLIKKRFLQKKVAVPDSFNTDMPLQIQDFIDRKVIEKLLYAKNF